MLPRLNRLLLEAKARLEPFVPPALVQRTYLWSVAEQALKFNALRDVQRNRRYENLHQGKRCFVLGNGASLKELDLARLRDEYTFTANSFIVHAERYGLRPYCHTIIDPHFFDPAFDDFATLKSVAERRHLATECFFPLEYQPIIEQFASDPSYLCIAGNIHSNHSADIAWTIPGLRTVVVASLLIAIYMGFSEIYLIGCDLDFLCDIVGVSPLRARNRYFYDHENATPTIDLSVQGFDYTSYCQAIVGMFDAFRFAGTKARPGQRILNASAGGLLDVFPRVDYGSLFPA